MSNREDDRWAKAERRALFLEDKDLGEAVRGYYSLYFPVGLVILMVLGTSAAALILDGSVAKWPAYLESGYLLSAIGVLVGGPVYIVKKLRPAAEAGTVGVVLSLDDDERKLIRREITGKTPFDPAHLSVSRGAAVQLRASLARQLILLPLLPLVLLPQIFRDDGVAWWLLTAGALLQTIAVAVAAREFIAAGRFLASTEDQSRSVA